MQLKKIGSSAESVGKSWFWLFLAHPGLNPVLVIASQQCQNRSQDQDAIKDNTESGAEVQVLCLWEGSVGNDQRPGTPSDKSFPSSKRSRDLFWLPTAWPSIRYAAATGV